jgi:hypothetical protein
MTKISDCPNTYPVNVYSIASATIYYIGYDRMVTCRWIGDKVLDSPKATSIERDAEIISPETFLTLC